MSLIVAVSKPYLHELEYSDNHTELNTLTTNKRCWQPEWSSGKSERPQPIDSRFESDLTLSLSDESKWGWNRL